jgi:insertion element IS1 protein InsB
VNQNVLQHLQPEQVEVKIWRADALEVRHGLSSELDEMWSYVHSKANPRWLWHAIDHHTGTVLAYVFGRRQDTVFLALNWLRVLSIRLSSCGVWSNLILQRTSPFFP